MKKTAFVCFFIFFCFSSVCAEAAVVSYEELKQKYVPQSTPEATYRLELELLYQGMYCYDLPLFDSAWRNRGKRVLSSSSYKQSAREADKPLKVYKEGKYAIIYFPQHKNLGPVFLYRGSSGWVIDRTSVWNYIHYNRSNTAWFAYEGNYPYLSILKKIFSLKKVKLERGVWAYQIK